MDTELCTRRASTRIEYVFYSTIREDFSTRYILLEAFGKLASESIIAKSNLQAFLTDIFIPVPRF